jgi:hypothetical protein
MTELVSFDFKEGAAPYHGHLIKANQLQETPSEDNN